MFLELIEFTFDSSFFLYQQNVYKQTAGTPVRAPASSAIANLVMIDLFTETLNKFDFCLPLIKLYVDDTILLIPKNKV